MPYRKVLRSPKGSPVGGRKGNTAGVPMALICFPSIKRHISHSAEHSLDLLARLKAGIPTGFPAKQRNGKPRALCRTTRLGPALSSPRFDHERLQFLPTSLINRESKSQMNKGSFRAMAGRFYSSHCRVCRSRLKIRQRRSKHPSNWF